MTDAQVYLTDPDPREGCTSCGSQATVTLDAHRGRRCPDHTTLPDGPFRRDLVADMCAIGRADAAFTYLGAYLAREIDRRFDALRAELQERS